MSYELEQAAHQAIDAALGHLGAAPALNRTYKTDRDYATVTDFAIEDDVRDLLEDLTPNIGFLGEERGHSGNDETFWCLDPIDGTTNFSRGIPQFGVALSLIRDGRPVFGEIVLPAHDERYWMRTGAALMNDVPQRVSVTASLTEAIVAVGDFATGENSSEKNQRRLAILAQLMDQVGRVRMLGSAATDFAWLIAGRLDAVVMPSNKLWDVGAGIALAEAAGAVVTHHDGTPYTVEGPNVLAATPAIHRELVDLLARR